MTQPLLRDVFAFRFARAYRLAGLPFGITPASTRAVFAGADLQVHFGPWKLQTPLDNISDVAVTGPYRFLTTAGSARLALTDRGLTFATNGERGVLLSFKHKVAGIEPTGLLRHPELTLTLADIDGFVGRIREAGN